MGNGVRLANKDLEIIKQSFVKYFLTKDHLWIFGSRVDLNKHGGDIDLYIETSYENIKEAINSEILFYSALQNLLGEQRIDIVVNSLKQNHSLLIYDIAKTEGVKLI